MDPAAHTGWGHLRHCDGTVCLASPAHRQRVPGGGWFDSTSLLLKVSSFSRMNTTHDLTFALQRRYPSVAALAHSPPLLLYASKPHRDPYPDSHRRFSCTTSELPTAHSSPTHRLSTRPFTSITQGQVSLQESESPRSLQSIDISGWVIAVRAHLGTTRHQHDRKVNPMQTPT